MLIDGFTPRPAPETAHEEKTLLDRRAFLKSSVAVGGGLMLSVSLPATFGGLLPAAAADAAFMPGPYLRIDTDGRVTITLAQVEMGQGTYTSMPMLIAEELDVGLDQVHVEQAPPDDKAYINPLLGFQVTGGSTSVRALWEPLRQVGATARAMLVSAAAAEWKVDPSTLTTKAGVVSHAATGRTLTYGALATKAAALPVPEKVQLKDPTKFTLIGTPARRLDTPMKVNGTAKFGIDVLLPGMSFAAVAISPTLGGKLASVDEAKAKAVRGVKQVVKLDDAVAVIAAHMGAARKGLEALDIKWDAGPNAAFSTADLVKDMRGAVTGKAVIAVDEGKSAEIFEKAGKVIEADYELPFLAHAAMEPMNCTVHVRPDSVEVWVGTQVMTRAQAAAAEAAGVPPDKVTVHNYLLGGGFGRRLDVDGVTLATRIAKQVDGPVKVIWSREEDTQHDVYRPYYYDRLKAALGPDGLPLAFSHRVVGSSILARWAPPFFKDGLDSDAVEAAAGVYDFPAVLVDYVRHEPPAGVVTGWWRGVGVTHNAFMVEGFVDELANAAGKDPVDYRRALLVKDKRARAVLDLAAEKAGWGTTLPEGRGRGISVLLGFGSYVAQVAEVSIAKDGTVKVDRVVCAVDCGRVVNPDTVVAQMQGGIVFGLTAVLHGNITLANGQVEQGNFDSYEMLRMDAMPAIEVHLVASLEAPGGTGEPGTAAIAPAVVNAVHATTGKRLRSLPVNAEALTSG
ncbi:MAG TPA: xanthine dehydrogenase family protein molybdopterin-binding subunit [Reyranella sp.]|nr:xanthine dehydrogenase family protein molybdopterin-binding subunit [Reyranella sp.]